MTADIAQDSYHCQLVSLVTVTVQNSVYF